MVVHLSADLLQVVDSPLGSEQASLGRTNLLCEVSRPVVRLIDLLAKIISKISALKVKHVTIGTHPFVVFTKRANASWESDARLSMRSRILEVHLPQLVR